MGFKLLILTTFQLYLSVRGQSSLTNINVDIIPTPTPISINPQNCTKFSSTKDYWFTFNNGINACFYTPSDFRSVSWHEAKDICASKNSTLVSIHNYTTNYLLSHRKFGNDFSTTVYWIGLNSLTKRGQYKWSDNTPSEFNNYSNRTSNGDYISSNLYDQGRCVSIRSLRTAQKDYYKDIGKWFKEDCNQFHKYICERRLDSYVEPNPPSTGNCASDWYQFAEQKCIKLINGSMNFSEAKAKCIQMNAEVLAIHSQEEQDFITAIVADNSPPYLGLKRKDSYLYNSWQWDDQTKVTYTNLGIQSTNYSTHEYCAIVSTTSTQPGKWLKSNCNQTHSVLCQKEKDPNNPNPGMTLSQNKCKISGFEDFIQYRNSCYSVVDSPYTKFTTFSNAEKICQNINGSHLVSIVDPFERSFLKSYLIHYGNSDNYWIGLKDNITSNGNMSHIFEWTDLWPVYYTYWDKNEPELNNVSEEECASLSKRNSTWRTTSCNSTFGYICKTTTNSLPKMDIDRSGVCPQLNDITDKSLFWVDIDRRSQYCYWFSVDRKGGLYSGVQTWSDSSFHCRRRNGSLVSLHSNHDLMLLRNKLSQTGSYYNTWIGLSRDPNGDYVWEDNTALDFTNWDPNEKVVSKTHDLSDDSVRQCVEVKSSDSMWRQQSCSGTKNNYFICEIRKIYSQTNESQSSTTKRSSIVTTNKPIGNNSKSGDKDEGLSGKAKAGIAFGVILGVVVVIVIAFQLYKRYRRKSSLNSSFDNLLLASRK